MVRFPLLPVCVLLLFACQSKLDPDATREVIGVWTTNDTRYAERYFEFREDGRLILGTGRAAGVPCVIEDVDIERKGGGTSEYSVTYLDPNGDESVLAFLYSTRTRKLRIKNQDGVVWRRRAQQP